MDNFDLRKYLIENRVTINSRLIKEGYVSPEGTLVNMSPLPTSGNVEFDEKFEKALDAASDSYGTGKDLLDGIENIMNLSSNLERAAIENPDKSAEYFIEPDEKKRTEFEIAYLEALEAAGAGDTITGFRMMHDRAQEYWKEYMSDDSKKNWGFS